MTALTKFQQSTGVPRAHYNAATSGIKALGQEAFARRVKMADVTFRNQGITFTVYSDQRGVDIKHTIGKALGRAGMAVVQLVRVKHDRPPRRARLLDPAIAECLDPGLGQPDRIALVPVRVIGVAAESGAQPLHPGNRLIDDKEIRSRHARTFNNCGAAAATMPVMRYETKTAIG